MSISRDAIGQMVELFYATDSTTVHASGRAVSYTDAPTVTITTRSGDHVHWRADLARVVAEPVVTVRQGDLDALVDALDRWRGRVDSEDERRLDAAIVSIVDGANRSGDDA